MGNQKNTRSTFNSIGLFKKICKNLLGDKAMKSVDLTFLKVSLFLTFKCFIFLFFCIFK